MAATTNIGTTDLILLPISAPNIASLASGLVERGPRKSDLDAQSPRAASGGESRLQPRQHYERALILYTDVDSPDADEVRARLATLDGPPDID